MSLGCLTWLGGENVINCLIATCIYIAISFLVIFSKCMGQTGLEKFSGVIVVFLLCPGVVQVLLKFWGQLCVVNIVLSGFFFFLSTWMPLLKGFHKWNSTSTFPLVTFFCILLTEEKRWSAYFKGEFVMRCCGKHWLFNESLFIW